MTSSVTSRLEQLTKLLGTHQVDMLWVPSTDEHLNEYVPEHHRRLEAITGFTGSAGTAILARNGQHQLFVDSRYHLQAEQEAPKASFTVHKLGLHKVLDPLRWLAREAKQKQGLKVGFDPFVMPVKSYRKYHKALKAQTAALVPLTANLIDAVWGDQPSAPQHLIYPLDPSFAGLTSELKLQQVREKLSQNQVQALVLTDLDAIAWLTNLRGSDIAFNPVFEAYAIILPGQALCFCHAHSNLVELRSRLPYWTFAPYAHYAQALKQVQTSTGQIWLDPERTTMGTYLAIADEKRIYRKEHPLVMMKALKNTAEIQCIQNAHQQSGSAKIRSFIRLERALRENQKVTEKDYAKWLYEEYTKEKGFVDLSFDTIAAAAENGAIVHYSSPSPIKLLEAGKLLLIDSGIQCDGGTTDDTRTLILGEPDEKQKRLYTQVLRAHVRLALQVFPEGTHGAALDAIARSSLWNQGLDFGHGTGHGVGAFLNVHEGPHRISPSAHQVALRPNMIVSNEPGYYEMGWGGIRLENLYRVVPASNHPPHPGGRGWLRLESLTLIPFDRRLIDLTLLAPEEQQWLQQYHQTVYQEMAPRLGAQEREWLKDACTLGT